MGKSQSASHSMSASSVAVPGATTQRGVRRRALQLSIGCSALAFSAFSCGGGLGDEDYVPAPRTVLNADDLANAPFCVGTCEPDFGSQRTIDCAQAEAGLEFFPGAGFPASDVLNPLPGGVITSFYSYNDNSSDFLIAGPLPFDPSALDNYEPLSVPVQDRCNPNEYVHHLRGGLFREWGGGMGRRMLAMARNGGCANLPALEGDPPHCPKADARFEAGLAAMEDQVEANRLRTNFYDMTIDVSQWEGISFWARSGPNNSGGVRVYVGDRQLDEDIAFLEMSAGLEPMCQRARECGCRNHLPCTLSDVSSLMSNGVPVYRCYDPAVEGDSLRVVYDRFAAEGREGIFDEVYETCGASLCDEDNPSFQINGEVGTAADPAFSTTFGNQCLPYVLTTDLVDEFCYNPDDPAHPPPDGAQRCGDGWAKGVALTGDWQFFKIPFTELRQEGYGKEFQNLDLSAVTLVRFTWTQGWVDVWLDDVRFYRQLSGAAQSE